MATHTGRAGALLDWYDHNRRDLPWRARPGETADPYRVWLSEIMLQQTTVKAVIPYFDAFTRRWPTAAALAAAPRDDLLKAWAGLGYYARARNLHACAAVLARDHSGRFPDTAAKLRTLPGIGAYTSAAIAAIAFGERVAVVDGNVERVIARHDALETPLPKAKAEITARVDALTPADRPGDFAQAMMDLGATLCTPKRPACGLCPWRASCQAHAAGTETRYPVKAQKAKKPERVAHAFFLRDGQGRVLVRQRPEAGLLGAMTEIPTGPWIDVREPAPDPRDGRPLATEYRRLDGAVRHVFTHFALSVTVHAAELDTAKAPAGAWWVEEADLMDEALPSVMKKIVVHAVRAGA